MSNKCINGKRDIPKYGYFYLKNKWKIMRKMSN
jgi:hypothetical protein